MARSQHKINSSFVNIHHALHSRMAGAGHEISDAALRAVALARAARVSAGRRSDEHYRRLKRPRDDEPDEDLDTSEFDALLAGPHCPDEHGDGDRTMVSSSSGAADDAQHQLSMPLSIMVPKGLFPTGFPPSWLDGGNRVDSEPVTHIATNTDNRGYAKPFVTSEYQTEQLRNSNCSKDTNLNFGRMEKVRIP